MRIQVSLKLNPSETDPDTLGPSDHKQGQTRQRQRQRQKPRQKTRDPASNPQTLRPLQTPIPRPSPRPRHCQECSPACGECGLYKRRAAYKITHGNREIRCLMCSFPECDHCGFRLNPEEAKAVQTRHKVGKKWFCCRSKACSAAKLAATRDTKT